MALSSTMSIALLMSAKTKAASKSIDRFTSKTTRKLARLSKKSQSYIRSGATDLIVGRAILKPLGEALTQTAEFQDKFAKAVVDTGAKIGSVEFAALKKQALDLTTKFGDSTDSVTNLYDTLVSSGVATKNLNRVALQAEKMGKAFSMAPSQAAEAYIAVRRNMNLTSQEANKMFDSMNAAIVKFGGDASKTMQFLRESGTSLAQSFGLSRKETIALANTYVSAGVKANRMSTSLESLHKAISSNAQLKHIFDAAGKGMKGLLAVMKKARDSGNVLGFLQSHGLGNKPASVVTKVIDQFKKGRGLNAQAKFLEGMNTSGSVSKKAAQNMQSYSEKMKKFMAQMNKLKILVGTSLLPAITSLINQFAPLFNMIGKFAEKNKGLVKIIVGLIGLGGGLKVLFGIGKIGFGTLITPIAKTAKFFSKTKDGVSQFTKVLKISKTAFAKVGKAFSAIGKFMMANPWIIIIAAIAVAAYLIIKNWDKVKAFFIKLWDGIKKVFSSVWNWIKKMFLNYTPYGLIIKHWDKISAFFVNLWDKVKGVFSGLWDWLVGWIEKFNNIGQSIVDKIWNGIKNAWQKLTQLDSPSSKTI